MSDPYAAFSSPASSADPYAAFSSPSAPQGDRKASGGLAGLITGKPAPKQNALSYVSGAMANFNRGTGIGDELAAGIGAIGDTLTGNVPKTSGPTTGQSVFAGLAGVDPNALAGLGSAFNRRMAQQRQIEDSFTAAHPNVAALARGTGTAATIAVPTGEVTAGLQGGRVVNALRGATMAGATAAGYAALDRGTAQERLAAASRAATNPVILGLGAAGGALTPTAPRAPQEPSPVAADAPEPSNAKVLSDAGVSLTPGQRMGGMAKGAEDLAQRSPILGPAIQGARERGVVSLNRAVANRALAPIGEGVPANIPAGNKTVEFVAQQLGKAYDDAAAMVPVVAPDAPFASGLANIKSSVAELGPNVAGQFDTIVKNRLDPVLNKGTVSGADIRGVQSDLGRLAAKIGSSDDGLQRDLGSHLDDLSNELGSLLGRTNPDVAPKIEQANQGYAVYARLRNAAAKSAKNGVFTPGQLSTSVRTMDRSVGKGDVAKGNALLQDLSSAASTLMPDQFGNPGTANFLSHTGLATTMVAAPQAGIPTAAGLTAAATPYFLMGRRIVTSLPSEATTAQLRTAAADLARLAANDPAVAALQNQVTARLARAVGVSGAAQMAPKRNALATSP